MADAVNDHSHSYCFNVVAIFDTADELICTAVVDEVTHGLDGVLPAGVGATPDVHLALHLGGDHTGDGVQEGIHVLAAENGVAVRCVAGEIGAVEFLVVQQCVEYGDVSLTAHVAHAFRVTWICGGASVRDTGVVNVVAKGGIQVPQDIAPALGVAVWMTSSPPSGVPVEPVGTYHVSVQDEVIDQTLGVELRLHVLVVGRIGHVVAGNEVYQVVPVIARTVLFPGTAPSLEPIHKTAGLVVVVAGVVQVIGLFADVVHAPVFTVEVYNAVRAAAFVHLHVTGFGDHVAEQVTAVRAVGKTVIVVGRSLEDETLVLVAIGVARERVVVDGMVVPHLVAGDVIKPALVVGV